MLRLPLLLGAVASLACTDDAASRNEVVADANVMRPALASFRQLSFMEGRWRGVGPDGVPFYEHFRFVDDSTMRSYRFPDSTFATPQDSSTVTLVADRIESSWGDHRWRASAVDSASIHFEPLEGTSDRFTLRRVSQGTLQVQQQWTDDKGRGRSRTTSLERLANGPTR